MSANVPSVIDIGLNLTHKSFQEDLLEVVERAKQADVDRMILTGSSVEDSQDALNLARRYSGTMFSTAGIHPHHAADCQTDSLTILRQLAQEKLVVAIGECGLDYFRDFSPREAQRSCFRRHLDLAQELQLPVFLHERDAHDDFLSLLEPAMPDLKGAVVHCFTDSPAVMQAYLNLGCYLGITGWVCDERRGEALRQSVPLIPDDRLMIETDAPYLMPRDLPQSPKSRRNEPCHLPHIGREIASLRNQSYERLAELTTRNTERFFELPKPENTTS